MSVSCTNHEPVACVECKDENRFRELIDSLITLNQSLTSIAQSLHNVSTEISNLKLYMK